MVTYLVWLDGHWCLVFFWCWAPTYGWLAPIFVWRLTHGSPYLRQYTRLCTLTCMEVIKAKFNVNVKFTCIHSLTTMIYTKLCIPFFFFGVVSSITATEDTNSSNTLSLSSIVMGLSSLAAPRLPRFAAAFISFSLFLAAALFSRCSASLCFCSSETSGSAFRFAGPRNFYNVQTINHTTYIAVKVFV